MVAKTKDEQRREFSRRLVQLLHRHHGAPEARGAAKWFERDLNRRLKYRFASYESFRKWISGEEIPDQANLGVICTAYGFSPTYLQTGEGNELASSIGDERLALVNRIWADLSDEGQKIILDAANVADGLYSRRKRQRHG